nr:hypothetical protein [Dechloromonas sp.]
MKDDSGTIRLTLQQGEACQIVLDAGSTVLLLSGRVRLRMPLGWMAETAVYRECLVQAEEAWIAESSGSLQLVAVEGLVAVIFPAHGVSFWRRVGRCLESVFAGTPSSGVARSSGGKLASEG